MKKNLLLIGVVVLLIGFAYIGYQIREQRREEIRVAEEQREIKEAYLWIYYAVAGLPHGDYWHVFHDGYLIRIGVYQSPESLFGSPNEFGIYEHIYVVLRMYEHRGGVYLPYDIVIEYLSEEFEPDGTLRLYNNGRHPEIEAFVEWMRKEPRITSLTEHQVSEYRRNLERIYSSYFGKHREQGFRSVPFHQLSPQMLDALARAEADPEYVLDLTSLQEAGY